MLYALCIYSGFSVLVCAAVTVVWLMHVESCSSSSIELLPSAVTPLNILTSPFHIIRQGCVLANILSGGFRVRDFFFKWELFSVF